jgi:hypothetical protein
MKIDLLNTRACLVHLLILSYSSQRQAKLSWLRVFCEFGSHEWSNLQLIFVDLNESGHPCLSMKSTCVYLLCRFLRSLCVCVCIHVFTRPMVVYVLNYCRFMGSSMLMCSRIHQANGCLCADLLSIHGLQYAYVFVRFMYFAWIS